jgi:hypothetical protein
MLMKAKSIIRVNMSLKKWIGFRNSEWSEYQQSKHFQYVFQGVTEKIVNKQKIDVMVRPKVIKNNVRLEERLKELINRKIPQWFSMTDEEGDRMATLYGIVYDRDINCNYLKGFNKYKHQHLKR